MKVYIAVDTEGEACVTREAHPETVYGTWQADYIRTRATAEATAAVEGARAAGADEVLVHDCGFIRGASPIGLVLHYDDLPRGIEIALGGAPIWRVCDDSYDAAILIGHHAMAGVEDGVMAHTFSSATIKSIHLNGTAVGEIAIEALWFGAHGVPVVMVSADEAGCAEATQFLGDVEVAPTKRGLGTHQAISRHPVDADDLIRAQTKAALERLGDFTPYRVPGPYALEVTCFEPEMAVKRAARWEAASMSGECSYIVTAESALELRI